MGLGDWIAGLYVQDDVEKGKELDDKLAALNRDALARGIYDSGTFAQAENNRMAQDSSTYAGQVVDAFGTGWAEGEKNVSDTVSGVTGGIFNAAGSVVGAPLRGLLSGLPWWAWIVGVVAILAWLGLLPSVVASARSAFKK